MNKDEISSFKNKKNLLLSAFNCAPNKGSEHEVGFQWIQGHIRKNNFNIYLLTQSKNLAYLPKNLLPDNNIIAHDLGIFEKLIKNTLGGKFHYYIWQLTAYLKIRFYYKKYHFDIIHHVSWATIRFPIFLSLFKSNLIIGPVGGGEIIPFKFFRNLSLYDKIIELSRYIHNKTIFFFPLIKKTFSKSKIIYVANKHTYEAIPKNFRYKTKILTSVGLNNQSLMVNVKKSKKDFKVLFVGRLVNWKGIDIILDVLKINKIESLSMTFVGSGKYLKKILKFKKKYNKKIEFFDHVDNKNIKQFMSNYDLLLFPSLRDSGGLVILEAIQSGLKVLVLDTAGPAELVKESNGKKININQKYLKLINEINLSLYDFYKSKTKLTLNKNNIEKEMLWKHKIDKFYKDIFFIN